MYPRPRQAPSTPRSTHPAEGRCYRVLSFGAGVNSTAILCLHAQGKYPLDAVVFADTRCEHPETYEYVHTVVEPFCKQLCLPFHFVSHGNLLLDYWRKNIIPFRQFRSCTDRYKIRPIRRFVKKQYGENIVYILGIDYGEKHRAARYTEGFTYPLIEMQMDRQACHDLIAAYGLPIPRKSGCFFCPFTKKAEWTRLLNEHRDLFLKAEEFEKHARKYPEYTLTNKPLEQIRRAIENQQSLCDWMEGEGEPCVFCHT